MLNFLQVLVQSSKIQVPIGILQKQASQPQADQNLHVKTILQLILQCNTSITYRELHQGWEFGM
uniref:Uncharacterized protein n=1 Tax=Aegilops tauschii subsp. strangulata TaxID=200361 RepID=A0A453PQM9_AEGTS